VKRLWQSWSWHYAFGHEPDVDFCLWVLERDGLPVAPFDRHGAGDGTLRAAGLDADGWRQWFTRVIDVTGEQHRHRRELAHHWRRCPHPADLWHGFSAVGHRLQTLAEEYEEIWDERAARKLELARIFETCADQLWKDLAPFRRRLPPVRIVTVGYPGPLCTTMPPETVVLAIANWRPEPAELAVAIRDGFASLAELCDGNRPLGEVHG
jgi:hypothetical protein